tara:strand:- start:360 stop:785 length:426 start_codon:yes stop_codon:yes gene_type:complete
MISWKCKHTWKKSAQNTAWCLLGCSIGDFGTIFYFQNNPSDIFNTTSIMALAIVNGLITSVALETFILSRQMNFSEALKTALGMSFISMIAMEIAMNITDVILTGGAILTWWAMPIMLLVGFLTPWPYNYWRLKKYNESCH